MRTIYRHITSSFLVSFLATLAIFTFVMSIGVVFKITDLLARGVSWRPVFLVLLYGIPAALAFSIPVSALTSSLLVFGRLSADGEINAMKACGVNMWQIISTPLLLGLLFTVFCAWINNEIAPRNHYARRKLIAALGAESTLELLEEGRFNQDFAGLTVYIERKKEDRIYNVRIYDLRESGVKREIFAKSGVLKASADGKDLVLDLHDVDINPFYDDKPAKIRRWPLEIKNVHRRRQCRRREEDMTVPELMGVMRNVASHFADLDAGDRARKRMSIAVELNKRLALSLASFAFVLLGVPLGITAQRKESSVGVGISLFLVFNFYVFIIVAESLANRPELRPDFIVWLPVIISITLGSYLVERSN